MLQYVLCVAVGKRNTTDLDLYLVVNTTKVQQMSLMRPAADITRVEHAAVPN